MPHTHPLAGKAPEAFLESLLSGDRPLSSCAHEIHDLKSGRVTAVEILTRYTDEAGVQQAVGNILRDIQCPAPIRAKLDLACVEGAFSAVGRNSGRWDIAFINLEPATLAESAFWNRLPGWMQTPGLNGTQVVIELTESCSALEMDDLHAHSRRLRDFGVRIAVDDLGSGVASLTHMARLAPDYIKADQSLVRLAHRRPYQAALLNALAHFARRMCVGFIAEGIETAEELQAVQDADVPWAQGFVYGEPVPLA
jgi:EAL domain-containing protein (putative c-di-GMP-specific phosphodiesterase class I)